MRLLGVFLAVMMPIQAMALSCLRPSVARTYQQAAHADETYVVVHGRLVVNLARLPKHGIGSDDPPALTRIKGRITGKSLSRTGFTTPFDKRVMVEIACFGPWCGSVSNGHQVLAFLRRDGAGYTLDVNPCGGHVFTNPDSAILQQVVTCYQGGDCTPPR